MQGKTILVFGATGRMGGAAARYLASAGWRVRAVTRKPDSESAQALAADGIDVVQGDLDAPASLKAAFEGVYGVFLVVNGWEHGFEGEVRHGTVAADLAVEAGVQHLVFAAAGVGKRGTGIPHFESKLDIEEYLNAKGIPLTTIFPPPFMELMTDPAFYPQAGAWNGKVKVIGRDYRVPWIASEDVGRLAANVFADPKTYIGKRLLPVGDWKTMAECQSLYKEVAGRNPPRWPMPVWLLRRMQPELVKMWEWMRDLDASDIDLTPLENDLHEPTGVRDFLQRALAN